ncbi:MAG: MarR family transcriptional regulator [Dehalococcoidia bacterium]|nr:MarR family transcriptional regulator [Dehalococcoidia bacterium]
MIVSESKISNSTELEEALIALPILRRWLLRSYPHRNKEGEKAAPLSHLRVIIHLHQHGPMMMTELAHGLGISCSTATECVSELEARGRVIKARSQSDRRGVVVSLTPDAEAVASKAFSYRREVLAAVLEQMSVRERKAFVKGLSLLAQSAENWMDEHVNESENRN